MIRRVLVQLDLAEPHEIDEWRQAMVAEGMPEAPAALDRGELVLGSLYVEAEYGTGEDDAVGLTMAGVELVPGDQDALARVDEEWLSDALAECAQQLADEQGIAVGEQELRAVLELQASTDVLDALRAP